MKWLLLLLALGWPQPLSGPAGRPLTLLYRDYKTLDRAADFECTGPLEWVPQQLMLRCGATEGWLRSAVTVNATVCFETRLTVLSGEVTVLAEDSNHFQSGLQRVGEGSFARLVTIQATVPARGQLNLFLKLAPGTRLSLTPVRIRTVTRQS